MSDWVGALLSLLTVLVPLVVAWWLVARGVGEVTKRRRKIPR